VRDEEALAALVMERIRGAAAARVRLTGITERLWSEPRLREALSAADVPLAIEDETVLVPGPETYRALGGKETVPGQFLREILERRDAAPDEAARGVLNRAMVLGLTELLEAGRSHVD